MGLRHFTKANSTPTPGRSCWPALQLLLGLGFILSQSLLFPVETAAQRSESIAWIDQDHSCQNLKKEIKRRYSGIGAFEQISETMRHEVRLVLDTICSARFSHCGFKNCPPISEPQQAALQDKNPETPPISSKNLPTDSQVTQEYEATVEAHKNNLQMQIAEAQHRETLESRSWVPIVVSNLQVSRRIQERKYPEVASPHLSPPTAHQISSAQEFSPDSPAVPSILPLPSQEFSQNRAHYLSNSSPHFHRVRLPVNLITKKRVH